MKTKKLWALLVAAVMVIGLLPVSAFAAQEISFTMTINNTAVTFDRSEPRIGTDADATAYLGRVYLNYSSAFVKDALLSYSYSTDATSVKYAVDTAYVTSPSGGLGSSGQIGIKTAAVAASQTPLSIVSLGLTKGAKTEYYKIIIYSNAAPSFNLTTTNGLFVSSPNFASTSNSVQAGTSITLKSGTALGTSGSSTATLRYYQFSTPVKVTTSGALTQKNGGAIPNLNSVTTAYGVNDSGEVTFIMPSSNLTITAVDTNGNNWGTSTPGTGGGGTVTGTYSVSVSSGVITWSQNGVTGAYNKSYYYGFAYGDRVTVRANYSSGNYYNGWNISGALAGSIVYSTDYREATFTVANNVYASNSYADSNYDLTAGSASGGYATISSTGNTNEYKVTATSYSGYYFSGWSLGSNASYVSGYSSSSNPTYVKVSGSTKITPSFVYGYDPNYGYPGGYYPGYPGGYYPGYPGGYYPGYPSGTYPGTGGSTSTGGSSSTSNTFGTGTAQATVTSTGVTAGYNASGSINSTNTANAIKRYFTANPSASSVNVTIPSAATAMSASTAKKLIAAAGSKTVTLVNSATFGSMSYSLTTARNYYFGMNSNNSKYTSARTTIVRAYGNTDTRGFSLSVNNLGASATLRIKVASLGISAGAGDTVYALFYNPSTNGFTRKTLVVNSAGEVTYATTRGGVHLFSETPFAK
ncbi:MAG: hypothetical protein LBL87_07915 [Ruminococcus sp.]|jgi:hypothetical protein|nr:hypothetical protein [Ruminococcus sp.]